VWVWKDLPSSSFLVFCSLARVFGTEVWGAFVDRVFNGTSSPSLELLLLRLSLGPSVVSDMVFVVLYSYAAERIMFLEWSIHINWPTNRRPSVILILVVRFNNDLSCATDGLSSLGSMIIKMRVSDGWDLDFGEWGFRRMSINGLKKPPCRRNERF